MRNISIGHGLTYLECPCCGEGQCAVSYVGGTQVKITITIDTEPGMNARQWSAHVADILVQAWSRITRNETGKLLDSNGNTVGSVTVSDEP